MQFLFVCTANICRSPMAAALFAHQLPELDPPVAIGSAGLMEGGRAAPDEVLEVMASRGIDLSGHESRSLEPSLLGEADLIVGMGRRHVQEAVLLDPSCWPRAFMLRELVRRGSETGPRRPHQDPADWIADNHRGRTRSSLVDRSTNDDIADPYGGPLAGYRSTADELHGLTTALAGLLWPPGHRRNT